MNINNHDFNNKIDGVFYSILLDLRKYGIPVEYRRKIVHTKSIGTVQMTRFDFHSEEDLLFYKLVGKYKEGNWFKFRVKEKVGQHG